MGKYKIELKEGMTMMDPRRSQLLTPFVHQVGGHVGIFARDSETICKPFTGREHDFYHFLPQSLRSFVPAFKGLIDVSFEADVGGYLLLRVIIPDTTKTDPNLPEARIRWHSNGSINIESELESQGIVFQNFPASDATYKVNPWGLKCQSSLLASMMKMPKGKHKFLMLENLVAKFSCPCILDLKLGTRQHGDDAPKEKIISQTFKCQRSTSGKLGLRICGMQVYQPNIRLYRCTDKYRGRTFTEEDFKMELRLFLGERFLDLSASFLKNLEALEQTLLASTEGFRFFSSSLLLLYDGNPDPKDGRALETDVRMIDFEHSTSTGFRNDPPYSGLDQGYMMGLRNLILTISDFKATTKA